MKVVTPQPDWPESWRYSYPYDQMEIYGDTRHRGYALAYANRRRETLRLIAKAAPPGARILDVAAAQGNFSLALAEAGYEVTWNDLRADLADYVRLKHERGTIHYAPGNVFTLGFDDAFDVVLIAEVIEHVAHPDAFLAKVAKMVKPGGHIVMTTPNGAYLQNKLPRFSDCPDPSVFESVQFGPDGEDHIFLLHPDEIAPIARAAGLEVVEASLFTNPLTNGFMKTAPLLKVAPAGLVHALERLTRSAPGPVKEKLHTAMAVLLRRPA
jgi:2-polyprenyl-6-hydroxyphenyl methylase/3-demethylubiquinone-9 3-methyltransferase